MFDWLKQKTRLKQTLFGVVLIVFSIFAFIALFSYSAFDNCFSTSSTSDTVNLCGNIGAYFADFFIQILGITNFFMFFIIFALGWKIVFKDTTIKNKILHIIFFILILSIILTMFSSREIGEIIMQKIGIKYLAGGSIGYLLTKLIFVTLIHDPFFIQISFIVLVIIDCLLFQKILSINFDIVLEAAPKIIDTLKGIKSNQVNKNLDILEEIEEQEIEQQQKHVIEKPIIVRNSNTYQLPSTELLDKHAKQKTINDEMLHKADELHSVLEEFGVHGEILNVRTGPVVTLFEFRPAPGIKTSRVISLSDDIARSMSATSARISIIPGQNAIGIELPNQNRQTVYLKELLSSEAFSKSSYSIPIALGKDINGNTIAMILAI